MVRVRPKKRLTLKFSRDLKSLLRVRNPAEPMIIQFYGRRTVGDLIEACGIPHTEISVLRVEGRCQGFSYRVRDGETVEVFSAADTRVQDAAVTMSPRPPSPPAFVCDVHLGKLSRFLRILGFDVDYKIYRDDASLADIARRDNRILLSRDRGLLMRKSVRLGMLIRSDEVNRQTAEVVRRYELRDLFSPFTRCSACNGLLRDFTKNDPVFSKFSPIIPPKVRERFRCFAYCLNCNKVYWPGTHYDRLIARIAPFLS